MDFSHDVNRINEAVRDIMLRFAGDSFIGLIAQGSAVKGGVIPGSSDIDYILYVDDSALNEADTLPPELCIAMHLALSAIDVRPFRYIQFSVLSARTNRYLGPIPGAYRLLAGRLLVPETTDAALYADAVSVLDKLVPAQAFDPHRLLDHGEDRIERSARLMCTIVWPLAYQLLTAIHKEGVRIWRMTKQEAIAMLACEPAAAEEIAAFHRAVQAYYPQEQSPAKALDVIRAGIAFIAAVKRCWEAVNSRAGAGKLILVEGIPGSGKSTTAQHIALQLGRLGVPHKWWYEEEQGHPVYVYDDYAGMQAIVDELRRGNYRLVIDKALRQWKAFAAAVEASPETVVADSCLFGYLTWSLFPYNVAAEEIRQYLVDVERIIRPLRPRLVYYYQSDLDAALRRICARRGSDNEAHLIRGATEAPYGQSRGLQGFEGLVAYWQDYRLLTDQAFGAWPGPKLAIDNSEGDWLRYEQDIRTFLGLEQAESPSTDAAPSTDMAPGTDAASSMPFDVTGCYRSETEGLPDCRIFFEQGLLHADGLPHAWRHSRLIAGAPNEPNLYHVQSLPLRLRFEPDGFRLTGPDLLDGPVSCRFRRKSPPERQFPYDSR